MDTAQAPVVHSTPHTSSAASRVGLLDSWRVVAVCLVMADHFSRHPGLTPKAESAWGFLANGTLGVLIFFFVSGYAVMRSSQSQLAVGAFSARSFYLRRAFRILPPFLLYLAALVALTASGIIQTTPPEIAGAALFLCNTSLPGLQCGWFTGHAWSLAFEQQFYLLFPMLAIWISGVRPTACWTTRQAMGFGLAAVMAALPLFFPIEWVDIYGFLMIYALFLSGMLFAQYHDRLKSLPRAPLVVSLALSAMVCFMDPVRQLGGIAPPNYENLFIGFGVYTVAIPMMVASSLLLAERRAPPVLTRGLLPKIGMASYSIYLWQQLATAPAWHHLPPAAMALGLVLVVLLSLLSYQYWEQPIIHYGRRLSQRYSPPTSDRAHR